MRFDPEVTNGQALADGITGLGYPARHLSTVVSGGAGGGNGNSNGGASSLSLEVMGVAGPGGVAKVRMERKSVDMWTERDGMRWDGIGWNG